MDTKIEDLRSYIGNYNLKITLHQVYDILYSICERLTSIHSENLCHGDLHPGNLLRNWLYEWFLSDFGISGLPNMSSNQVYGNLPYIAPEVLNGKKYTFASDIYSIGMLMYEIATGLPPFNGSKHNSHLVINILDGKRPAIPKEHTHITPEYIILMEKCWNKYPNSRPTIVQMRDFFFDELMKCGQDNKYGSEIIKNYGDGKVIINSNQSSTYTIIEWFDQIEGANLY